MIQTTILTIGISPSWDIACFARDIRWGRHQRIDHQTLIPAGKALNVSRALATLGRSSIAAGLWGKSDIVQAKELLSKISLIRPRFTAVPGQTRYNITLVNTRRHDEMHLRCPNSLAAQRSMNLLYDDLADRVHSRCVCVFCGAIPDEAIEASIRMIRLCRRRGARVVVDTSSPALKAIVEEGGLWLIKPNVEELSELVGGSVANTHCEILKAARQCTDKAETVLVSRGKRGAMAISSSTAYAGEIHEKRKAFHTVGCGDYLLAGFVNGMTDTEISSRNPKRSRMDHPMCGALIDGIRLATLRAWKGDFVKSEWKNADSIPVAIRKL